MVKLERHDGWIRTYDGRWVQLRHCDLVEVRRVEHRWELVAWNAYQPQVEAHVLATFEDEEEAHRALDALFTT